MCSTLASLSQYATDCQEELPSRVDISEIGVEDSRITWEYGPSFVLLALASIFKLVDVVCHLLVPVPEKSREPLLRDSSQSNPAPESV